MLMSWHEKKCLFNLLASWLKLYRHQRQRFSSFPRPTNLTARHSPRTLLWMMWSRRDLTRYQQHSCVHNGSLRQTVRKVQSLQTMFFALGWGGIRSRPRWWPRQWGRGGWPWTFLVLTYKKLWEKKLWLGFVGRRIHFLPNRMKTIAKVWWIWFFSRPSFWREIYSKQYHYCLSFSGVVPIFSYHKHALANLKVGMAIGKFADRLIRDVGASADDFTLVGFAMGRLIYVVFP